MKKLAFVPMLLLVFAAGCEDDPPTEPTPLTPTFSMALLPSNEPSLPDPTESVCRGNVTIRFNVTRDSAQTITAANADFQATINSCPSTTVIRIAHIHQGDASVPSGTIVVNTGLSQGDVTLVAGAGSFTKNNVAISPLSLAQQIIDNPNGFYFNIHSATNPGGVLRAQMVRTQ
jgi:hypothetical protein